MNTRPLLNGIRALQGRSRNGELAFLCLSGKSENHIRDLVAFNVAKAHPRWVVRREVGNIDLTIENTVGAKLNVEFKIGYACVIATRGRKAQVLRSAKRDLEKRSQPIVSCIGLMHFSSTGSPSLDNYRNPPLLRRALAADASPGPARSAVRSMWPSRAHKYVSVDCGRWDGIDVLIDFVVVEHGG